MKKEKEIMKQHRRGMKETKYNKTKGKKEQAQRKQEGEEKHDEIRGKNQINKRVKERGEGSGLAACGALAAPINPQPPDTANC